MSDKVHFVTDLPDGSIAEFTLTPLTKAACEVAYERRETRLRWREAFDLCKTLRETHSVLPKDRGRQDHLGRLVLREWLTVKGQFLACRAVFSKDGKEVVWETIEGEPSQLRLAAQGDTWARCHA